MTSSHCRKMALASGWPVSPRQKQNHLPPGRFGIRVAAVALVVGFCLCSAATATEANCTLEVGGVAMARPLLLRSDFASKDIIQRLFVRSKLSSPEAAARFVGRHSSLCKEYFHPDYVAACREYVNGRVSAPPVPQLKSGAYCEVGRGFDLHGGPKFENVLLKKRIHFWETEFIEDYRGSMNRHMARLVAKNPEKYRGVLSTDTIDQYVSWAKNGKGPLNNPVLANGEICEYHHDVGSKRILVLSKNEHRGLDTLPSKGHGSGTDFAGGGNMTWGQRQPFDKVLGTTAARWGGVAGFDLVATTLVLTMSGCKDKSQYIANAGSVLAAALAATMSESLMTLAFPLSAGVTQGWIGLVALGTGGPAAWIASGVYLATRQAIMYVWDKRQLEQAARVEDACRQAERNERLWALQHRFDQNTETLKSIVSGVVP